jgi:uncharacterized repeat protein (TIGR01451 family)/CSLREA domain-containing protein
MLRISTVAAGSVLIALGAMVLRPTPALATAGVFVVESSGDTDNGSCGADCTLRDAITAANAYGDGAEIDFNLAAGTTITVTTSGLPEATSQLTIDGSTMPGYAGVPIVAINGTGLPSGTDGLDLRGAGSVVKSLVVQAFPQDGIFLRGGTSSVVNSYIGTTLDGTGAAGNGREGVAARGGGNTVGGSSAGQGNVLSGNGDAGVIALTSTSIQGNYIGTNAAGTDAIPNGNGVVLGSMSGGSVLGPGNVVSGNNGPGVAMTGTDGTVKGNLIGLNAAGSAALANGGHGVSATGASNTVGGSGAGEGNVISGNIGSGIHTSRGITVLGNLIGTNLAGDAAIPNSGDGVTLNGSGSTVGGNVIASNAGYGVSVLDSFAGNTHVVGNLIGTNGAGAAFGNAKAGVVFVSQNNEVRANTIANNGEQGVVLPGSQPNRSVTVSQNAIHDNTGLGFDIGADGVTANDAGDGDIGPNLRQNFPTVTRAGSQGSFTQVEGVLNSAPSTAYTVELFKSAACDSSGYGEGGAYLGTVVSTTDVTGHADFQVTFGGGAAQTDVVTGTATDPSGKTSEFSACTPVGPISTDLRLTKTVTPSSVAAGGTAAYTVRVLNAGAFAATNVSITDLLASSTRFVSVTTSQGTCTSGQKVSCALGDLAVEATATVTITIRTTQTGVVKNFAYALADNPDPNTQNNLAYAQLTVTPGPNGCTIVGTNNAETINGTNGNDIICGLGGADVIKAGSGDDIVYGGNGADTITGGSGKDTVYGEAGADTLNIKDGVSGNDTADGGSDTVTDHCTADSGDTVTNCP